MKNNKHVESFGQFNENLNISDVSKSITENWRDDLTHKFTKQDIIDIISNNTVEDAADEILEIMSIMTSNRVGKIKLKL